MKKTINVLAVREELWNFDVEVEVFDDLSEDDLQDYLFDVGLEELYNRDADYEEWKECEVTIL